MNMYREAEMFMRAVRHACVKTKMKVETAMDLLAIGTALNSDVWHKAQRAVADFDSPDDAIADLKRVADLVDESIAAANAEHHRGLVDA